MVTKTYKETMAEYRELTNYTGKNLKSEDLQLAMAKIHGAKEIKDVEIIEPIDSAESVVSEGSGEIASEDIVGTDSVEDSIQEEVKKEVKSTAPKNAGRMILPSEDGINQPKVSSEAFDTKFKQAEPVAGSAAYLRKYAPADRHSKYSALRASIVTMKSIVYQNPDKIEEVLAHIDFYRKFIVEYAKVQKKAAKVRAANKIAYNLRKAKQDKTNADNSVKCAVTSAEQALREAYAAQDKHNENGKTIDAKLKQLK